MEEEARLVDQAVHGSDEAFARIVRLHQAPVRAYLSRYVQSDDLVDDLAQDTFLDAYRTIKSYRGESALRTWLLGIARHRALRFLEDLSERRTHQERTVESAIASWMARDVETDRFDLSGVGQHLQALEKCLVTLPKMSTQLIEEFYFQGRSAVDIARRLGKKESAVWMTLLRVRRALRECIQLRLRATEAT